MKRAALLSCCAVLTVCLSLPAAAAGPAGVKMPEAIEAGGKSLPLVGAGLHSKNIVQIPGILGLPGIPGIPVDVYVAALYMETPTRNAAMVVSSDSPKAIALEFVYSKVSGKQLRDAWRDGFADNTPGADADLKARMDRFVDLFNASAKKGQRAVMTYLPGAGTTVTLDGREAALIPGADFASALFAIWFGDKPADAELKAAILK